MAARWFLGGWAGGGREGAEGLHIFFRDCCTRCCACILYLGVRYRGIRDFGDDEGGRFVMAGMGMGMGERGCTRWGIRLGEFVSGVCVCYTGEQT